MAVGLDIGTAFLVSATKDVKNESAPIEIKSIRDAFLDIEIEPSVLNMLKMSNVSYVQSNDLIYVLGDPAISISNLLKREVRRPMSKGVISPGELEAEKMLLLLLKEILKKPTVEDEKVYYSIPAKAINSEMRVTYHEAVFKKLIESLGFKAVSMNEAAAIVYSNCSKDGFSALSSSFGAGMVNTALVYRTIVGMSFSLEGSGDWIDFNAAKATGSTATRITSIKEKGVNLLNPEEGDPKYIREREAIVVYYRSLIHNVIDGIKKEFKKDQGMVELPECVPWIISGGTSKAVNFVEFFKQEFEKVRGTFPITISEIRQATDPLSDVAKGLLIAALND